MSTDLTSTLHTASEQPSRGSLAERIKQRAKARKPLELAIPRFAVGGEGLVVIRYGEIDTKVITAAQKHRSNVAAGCHILTAACQEVLLRDPDTGELSPASEDAGTDEPVQFDATLAEMFDLGRSAQTAGQICALMYANSAALSRHAARVAQYTTGDDLAEADDEEIDDLLGEEDAATSS